MLEIERVAQNRQTRSIFIRGEVASGKSYLLARLKKQLNPKAFFAYIGSWTDNDYIWRHVLRRTIDSLMHIPEGQKESQLLLWLKGMSAFQEQSLRKKILGERGLFIQNFRGTYPVGIYRPKEFFGVLYDLTNPELYILACDYTSFSLSYQHPNSKQTVGVVWIEAPKLQSFFYCVQACQKDIQSKKCDTLFLIRAESLGKSGNRGYTLFQQTFNGAPHSHLNPHLDSLHYLAAYSNLVKAAGAGELVVGYDTQNVPQLEALVRESQELHKCTLLQELGIVPAQKSAKTSNDREKIELLLSEAKVYLWNVIKIEGMIGLSNLIDRTQNQPKFQKLDNLQLKQLVQELVQEHPLNIIGDEAKPESLCICYIPQR
ncbi:MAG: hypothetical protein WBG66_11050 [Geitlerinemataceae cyanobacterium]